MKIGFVIQRYGTEVLGGSEQLCRVIAERLAARHQVEVITTCARDYITWKNEYPEGADRVRGVTVRRFANARTRDLASFNKYSDWIYANQHSRQDEIEWLKQQGPWAPALVDYLQRQHQTYDVLVFFTYLYAPTALGIKIDPSRSVLVPTAHDEPAIRLGIFQEVFSEPAALIYNSDAERRFVRANFHLRAIAEEVVGIGIDLPPGSEPAEEYDERDTRLQETEERIEVAPREEHEYDEPPHNEDSPTFRRHLARRGETFRRRHRLHGPFALYGGRIDAGKGCEELIEYFSAYARDGGEGALVLMGVKMMPIPEEPFIRFAGRLPDQERLQALEAATVVVVPSPFESLSIIALEGLAAGTPILVNARSEVLVDHCRQSNAGLYYADRDEFVECLKLLMGNEELRAAMGRNGREYVRRNYRWDVVIAKYERVFAKVRAAAIARR
jgi:glycosyltransferase involved in cell wall biosynthesis